ncbi:MAG TPA: LacI family DNA-binding transcriptional regulator [Thermoanaerobaculia bacterium]|nr:LacI family DNA-binding transcriptional regulator [Thermoanaerobaculia bacterium]
MTTRSSTGRKTGRVTLKDVANHLGLSSATVSVVLNRSPAADSIPDKTKDRVLAAVEELGYRPDLLARSLRRRRSHAIGVLVPNIGEDYAAGVMAGAEHLLSERGYFYLAASHRWQPDLLDENLNRLKDRSVEGLILIATPIHESPGLPTVVVAGHNRLPDVTNVIIDHDAAAMQALSHLVEHGHRTIAVLKGQPRNTDTADRWRAISRAASELGIEIRPELVKEIADLPAGDDLFSPERRYRQGFEIGQELLAVDHTPFTALFAFNDVSAIGAIRAFLDAGRRVPEDISVVGFDDIQSAPFQNPSLTTIHQPLRKMGELAASTLLDRLAGGPRHDFLTVEATLVVRGSSGLAPLLDR